MIRCCDGSRLVPLAMVAIIAVGCQSDALPRQDAALEIEMVAARSLLGSYRLGTVMVDSMYAYPSQAPPSMTSRSRPSVRQRALVDSLRDRVGSVGGDSLVVRASEPEVSGSTARITVTVDGRVSGGRAGRPFYETVAFVLARDGSRWVVRERTQLGVS